MRADFEKTIKLVVGKLETWYEGIFANLPNFFLAILVVVFFAVLSKWVRRIILKLLSKQVENRALINLVGSIGYFFTFFLGLFMALSILHLDKTVTSLLAGAGVIGLALGFAFQEIASNFVSGIFISLNRPFRNGDIVQIDDYLGQVASIDLRTTTIMTFDGIKILVPNKKMFTEPLKNFNDVPRRRLDIPVGVGYSTDLEKVENIVKTALEKLEGRIEDKEIEVFYKEFGGSSINFDVRIWIDYPAENNYLRTRHKAIIGIKKAFDENEINIPFPIRTLDINPNTIDLIKGKMESFKAE